MVETAVAGTSYHVATEYDKPYDHQRQSDERVGWQTAQHCTRGSDVGDEGGTSSMSGDASSGNIARLGANLQW